MRLKFILSLAALLAPISSCATQEDLRDLVDERYPRAKFPTPHQYAYDMAFPALGRPATPADVEHGQALFSFEGLGERRVWPLPNQPTYSIWHANTTHGSDNQGLVVQAEEVLIRGEWKLYFGFLSNFGGSVVPAKEVDLCLGEPEPYVFSWMNYPGGLDLGFDRPNTSVRGDQLVRGARSLDQPLMIHSVLRNRRGGPIRIPADLHRLLPDGRHSFRRGFRMHLAWAPFDPRKLSIRYPDERTDFSEVPEKTAIHDLDPSAAPGPMLQTGERVEGWSLDLRRLFEMTKDGHYMYWYDVDAAALDLGEERSRGISRHLMGFDVGLRPRSLTPEELNAEMGVLGGQAGMEHLRKAIQEGQKAPPPDKAGAKALPPDFPAVTRKGFMGGNMSGHESELRRLRIANRELLERASTHSAGSVLAEFETRMLAETISPPLRLLYAAQAAVCGSEKAALEILESMKSTQYDTVLNTLSAIRMMLHEGDAEPRPWVVELAMAAVADDRYVTGLEKTNWSLDEPFRISYLADEHENIVYSLGDMKCLAAVPLLIDRLRERHASRGYVMALGLLGDPRAIAPLLDFLRRFLDDPRNLEDGTISERTTRLIHALGNLKARKALPLLVEHLEYRESIEALESIGDARVVPDLRVLVKNRGAVWVKGKKLDWGDEDRWASARLALAVLEEGDPIPRLCALLQDLNLGEFQRRDVLSRLYARPDSRTIPVLIRTIRSDPSGSVVNPAIEVLAGLPYPEAVDGLIECFDAAFEGIKDWKRAFTPEMFRDNIAKSLRILTGQDLPADKKQWETWWKANRAVFKK